jgi:serine/threonine protein kinase
VAIKQLRKDMSSVFLKELDALTSTRGSNHPNIVYVLGAFRLEDNGVQTPNLLFPRACGSLRQLFRGSLDDHLNHNQYKDLWGQFEGLASALEYLHDECSTAHRDIKSSNVLLYENDGSGILRAKIADFGHATNLKGLLSWGPGTAETKSALVYDATEIRKHATDSGEKGAEGILNPVDLLRDDIWKLGSLFIELLNFLLFGSQGQRDFRKFITKTVDGVTSDSIERFVLHDEKRVKPEVIDWLSRLVSLDSMAAELVPLFSNMLGEAERRPTAHKVSKRLQKVRGYSGLFISTANSIRFSLAAVSGPMTDALCGSSDRTKLLGSHS